MFPFLLHKGSVLLACSSLGLLIQQFILETQHVSTESIPSLPAEAGCCLHSIVLFEAEPGVSVIYRCTTLFH